MTIRYAVANGNWSNPATWDGGTLPTSADDVRSNSFTVDIDQSVACALCSSKSETTPVIGAGGTFRLMNGVVFSPANITGGNTGANHYTVQTNLAAGESATINCSGTIQGGLANGGIGVLHNTAGTLSLVAGTIRGGGGSSTSLCYGVYFISDGNITASGITGGANGTTNYGIYIAGSPNVTINATAINGYAATAGHAVYCNISGGTIDITAACYGTGYTYTSQRAVAHGGTGTVNIYGACYGGATGPAITNLSTGILKVIGPMYASAGQAAIDLGGTASQVTLLSGPFYNHSTTGSSANRAAAWRWIASPSGTFWQVQTSDLLGTRNLYTADYVTELHMPAAANVRTGTTYGPVGEMTGSCSVPPAASVAVGVPVDATVGTAAVSAAQIADIVGQVVSSLV